MALTGAWMGVSVAWIALLLVGVGNALVDIFGFSVLNRLLPDHLAGRGWGAFYSASARPSRSARWWPRCWPR